MFTRLTAALALCLCVALGAGTLNAQQLDLTQAETFLQGVSDRAVGILESAESVDSKLEDFRLLFREAIHVPTVGRFVLGRFWRTATDTEKTEYLVLFEEYMISTYARRFVEYDGAGFEITGSRPEAERDGIVYSRLDPDDTPPLEVAWRIRDVSPDRDGSDLRIIDVLVENVSLGISQRDEFSSLISQRGGQVSALLDEMRARVDASGS